MYYDWTDACFMNKTPRWRTWQHKGGWRERDQRPPALTLSLSWTWPGGRTAFIYSEPAPVSLSSTFVSPASAAPLPSSLLSESLSLHHCNRHLWHHHQWHHPIIRVLFAVTVLTTITLVTTFIVMTVNWWASSSSPLLASTSASFAPSKTGLTSTSMFLR